MSHTSRNPSESEAIFNKTIPADVAAAGKIVVTLPNRKPFSTELFKLMRIWASS